MRVEGHSSSVFLRLGLQIVAHEAAPDLLDWNKAENRGRCVVAAEALPHDYWTDRFRLEVTR